MINTKVIMKFVITIGILVVFGILLIGEFSVRYVLSRKNSESYNNMNTSIISQDGLKLYAKEKKQINFTHKWAILVHSYGSCHSFMNPYADKYYESGYNTLAPDNRNHGVSEGKYTGMGYLDQYDIRLWVEYILNQDPDAEIVLHGLSMGGATVMMLAGQEDLPVNIKAVVEDCGYESASSYLTWKLKQTFHLPSFPVIPIANVAFKLRAGYYMSQASSIEGVKNSKVPILFIHGIEDQTVPVKDVYKLYDAANCQKDIYIVDGAGHGESLMMDEDKYWEKVFHFIEGFQE